MGTYTAKDRVTEMLKELGYQVDTYKLPGTSLILGGSFMTKRSQIVYRVDNNDTVVIIIYRRIRPKRDLANPFADFIWFIELLTRKELKIKRVKGLVSKLDEYGDSGLSTEKIKKFYKEYLGGLSLGWEYGDEWIGLDLKDYRTMRQIRKAKRKQSDDKRVERSGLNS